MNDFVGRKILHYKIIEKLGAGGMGVVYLAEDTKLERQVAIKFLPHHIAVNSDERRRFEIEAKAAAALNHASISTVFNIEESNGEIFIVMEYIDGKELKQLHIDDYQLTIDYAIQIAKGLQAAHEKGIVHRDIKSTNIMVTQKGDVKIMDFGLAKFRGSAQVTQIGTTMGTAAYMSPEQARGEDVDPRSDIWSFGVVLYELLTGQLPFPGDYEQAVIYSIINDPLPPLSELSKRLPADLERIITKSIAKSKDDRYQNVNEMLTDLISVKEGFKSGKPLAHNSPGRIKSPKTINRKTLFLASVSSVVLVMLMIWWQFGSLNMDDSRKTGHVTAVLPKSIAVLPFRDMSSSADQAWFGEGLAEEILSALTRIPDLHVIARQSSFAFANATIEEIRDRLGVTHVLSGSLRRDGSRARIRAQLTLVGNQRVLWSRDFQPELTDILDAQEEIARAVVKMLEVELGSIRNDKLMQASTNNPMAHENYLRGLQLWNRRAESDILSAIDHFRQAVEFDSLYAAAWAGLALAYMVLPEYSSRADVRLVRDQSMSAADLALKIDPNQPDALTAMGWGRMIHNYDWQGAEELISRALAMDSTNVNALHWQSHVISWQGSHIEAVALAQKAAALDPLSSILRANLAYILMEARKYENALHELERVTVEEPDFEVAYRITWNVNTRLGRSAKAAEALETWLIKTGRDPVAAKELSREFANAMDLAPPASQSSPLIKDLVNELQPGIEVAGQLFAALGDKETTLYFLEQAIRESAGARSVLSLKVNPLYDFLRADSSFKDLERRIGL